MFNNITVVCGAMHLSRRRKTGNYEDIIYFSGGLVELIVCWCYVFIIAYFCSTKNTPGVSAAAMSVPFYRAVDLVEEERSLQVCTGTRGCCCQSGL